MTENHENQTPYILIGGKTPPFFTITYIKCISIYTHMFILIFFYILHLLYLHFNIHFSYAALLYNYIRFMYVILKKGELFLLSKCTEFDFHGFLS
jgi:hypothetical protein